MRNIEDLKKAINNSDMNMEVKSELINFIQILTKIHIRVPLIYYAGVIYGLGCIGIGIFFVIPFAVICGIGVFLVALVAILEVIFTKRRLNNKNDY